MKTDPWPVRLGLRPEVFLSPLLGAALTSIQFKNREDATPVFRASLAPSGPAVVTVQGRVVTGAPAAVVFADALQSR